MSSTSLNKIAWNKFRKNNLSLFSLVFISCLIFLAVFAYLFIPDKTPMANQMYLELALKKPGTKISFIQVPQKNEIKSDFFYVQSAQKAAQTSADVFLSELTSLHFCFTAAF